MRRALGLRGPTPPGEGTPQPNIGSHAPRHDIERRSRRFVRDGEVQVVVLGRTRDAGLPAAAPSNRLVAAEAALQTERAARERAERSLQEAQETIQHLQTQLGHANLAHAELLAAERHAREAAERHLAEEVVARAELETRLSAMSSAVVPVAQASQPTILPTVRKPRAKSPTPARPAKQAKPVKWWLSAGKTSGRKG